VDNDVDFAVDLLNDALGEFSSHVDTMREAVAGKKDDWPLKVRIASHSIKGVAGNLSMERVHKSSAALETWGREREGKASDDDLDAASASVDRLDRYVGQIRTWAETARETLEAAGAN
jgi:HPt (histidine-containing phosphotransfer) domain-containing protein